MENRKGDEYCPRNVATNLLECAVSGLNDNWIGFRNATLSAIVNTKAPVCLVSRMSYLYKSDPHPSSPASNTSSISIACNGAVFKARKFADRPGS